MRFIFTLGVMHVSDFKSVTNDEGFSDETGNVGSCDDPALSTAVAPSLTAHC